MKAAILFTIKIFLLNFTPYFTLMSLLHYFTANEIPVTHTLFMALIFGVSLTVFHVYRHIREVKKLHRGNLKTNDFIVKQKMQLQLPLTKEQIVVKLHNSFPARDWDVADEPNAIKLKTSYSWKSYGEKVLIQVKKLNEELSEIIIESKPKNPLTFLDYGKNQENIIYLQKLLTP